MAHTIIVRVNFHEYDSINLNINIFINIPCKKIENEL